MDEGTRQIVYGLAVPALIAAAVILPGTPGTPGTRALREDQQRDRRAWRIPIGLAAPVAAAFLLLYGWPTEQWQYLLFVPVAGAIVGVAMALTRRTPAVRGALWLVLAALVTAALWPIIASEPLARQALPALGTLALAAGLEPLAVRRSGAVLPAALALAAGTSATIILISAFMKLAIPCSPLAIAIIVCAALALWKRRFSLADGAVAVVAPMLVAAPFVAWLYMASAGGDLPAVAFVLPAVAPLLLWPGELAVVRRRSPWIAVPLRWVPVVAACALAIVLALMPRDGDAPDDPYEDMYRQGLRAVAGDAT